MGLQSWTTKMAQNVYLGVPRITRFSGLNFWQPVIRSLCLCFQSVWLSLSLFMSCKWCCIASFCEDDMTPVSAAYAQFLHAPDTQRGHGDQFLLHLTQRILTLYRWKKRKWLGFASTTLRPWELTFIGISQNIFHVIEILYSIQLVSYCRCFVIVKPIEFESA